MDKKELFAELSQINVNDYCEKKNGLTYLSWAYAIQEICKRHNEEFSYVIKKNEQGLPYFYDEGVGYMVFTEVTIGDITRECWLPVMDGANKAMLKEKYTYDTRYGKKTVEACTMFDVNKTVMRCLVKNLAMFGLGLYIYAGEDLPETEDHSKDMITAEQVDTLTKLGVDFAGLCKVCKVTKIEDLTYDNAEWAIKKKRGQ